MVKRVIAVTVIVRCMCVHALVRACVHAWVLPDLSGP